ncbi:MULTISPECIES: phage tail terminator protein [unclassified Xanthobacter]|uniref:phage tail terminator protein n=1 Tax=unclassified Xanthobacter TaxID=2623496 RepID=UPI001EE0046D|nr:MULTISPECIES: hypothetical protein [unclassified Xanthobacter]
MSATAIRAALVALLEAIPDIGRVHAWERFAATEKGFIDLYSHAGAVRGWRVNRVSTRRRVLASGRVLVTDRWAITGMLSLVDAAQSEITASDLADAIIAAEVADPTLGGVARGVAVEGAAGVQLLAIAPVMFAGVLCHQVALQLDTQTFEGAAAGGLAGGLESMDGAAGRLIGAVVARLQGAVPAGLLAVVEGRLSWDRDDDPADLPAAIVVPVADEARPEAETVLYRQRVDRSVAVILIAPAGYSAGAGALAAGGLEALRERVRVALLGWGDGPDGPVDIPCLYAGGAPTDAAPGLIAWRDVYTPSLYVEMD